ncbi:hypothetical protein B0H67DRAFT_666792 [Lasiosphaeris hirsuta]|uniref:Uncharacterized protein n=1 Tax=Lasiosphaeris hirsuta TaxID=260670 RepID=A0AA40DUK9_9PEZI|nr:hypothetical protein B0H67DRAFT_666792 [Lasiosphaeris hirsuta]
MPFPCNFNVYITVEAVTLIGLTFVAAASFLINIMAKKKKSGSAVPKPPLTPGQQSGQKAIEAPKPAGAQGSVQKEGPATVAPPVVKVPVDHRPETSPYASPVCTIPFASPLAVPRDILLKSPKLHAAFESQLPALPETTDDIGHILVHYLHTGTYEGLKPKEVDTIPKQIAELKTAIRAYSAARAYELPDLMRLAQSRIRKYGEGLSLPDLLEITRDSHPTLSEGDNWFIDYLKSRIRPHLEDPKALLGSNLLDQISSILSPNRVLLRTVLEMFCERAGKTAPHAAVASPITSPGSSRPVSPPSPSPSPLSVLQMRSRAISRESFSSSQKKATPWPLAEPEASLAAGSKEATPEPLVPQQLGQEVKLDVKPEPEPRVQEIKAEPVPAPAPMIIAEPEPLSVHRAQFTTTIEPEILKPSVADEIKAAIDAEMKPAVETEERRTWSPSPSFKRRERKDSAKIIDVVPELEVGPVIKDLGPIPETEPLFKARPHQRILRAADSGFWDTPADLEQTQLKDSTASLLEIESEPEHLVKPEEPLPLPVHELETSPEPTAETAGVDTFDFGSAPIEAIEAIEAKDETAKTLIDTEPAVPQTLVDIEPAALVIYHEPDLPLAPEVVSRDPLESFPEPEAEPESDKASEVLAEPEVTLPSDSKALKSIEEEASVPEAKAVEEEDKVELNKEYDAQPATEKVAPPQQKSSGPVQGSELTSGDVQAGDAAATEPEPEPEPVMELGTETKPQPDTEAARPDLIPHDSEPAGSSQPETAEPVAVEPTEEPAREPEIPKVQPEAVTAPALTVDTALASAPIDKSVKIPDAQHATTQNGAAHTKPDTTVPSIAPVQQPSSVPERSRVGSWRKRFRYPAFFGRGM